MTYTYINGSEKITNAYNAHDIHMIANYMSQFIPAFVKQRTHSSDQQHKAYVNTDMTHPQISIDVALAHQAGIR